MGPNRWGSCRIVRSYAVGAPPAPRVASVPRKRDCGERTPPPVGYSWPSGPGSPIRDYPRDIATAPRLRNTSTPVFAARGSGGGGDDAARSDGSEVHVRRSFKLPRNPVKYVYIIPTQAWSMSGRRGLHRTVATSTSLQKHRNSRNTSHDSAMCMPAHGRSMAPHSHTHVMLSHTVNGSHTRHACRSSSFPYIETPQA